MEAQMTDSTRPSSAEKDAPTMTQAECQCPNDCDCDGRFACGEQAGETLRFCELVAGHGGWHQAANHRWQARVTTPAGGDA